MASSSISKRCFHCGAFSETFYFGWQLRNGSYAMLCHPCGYAFNEGRFCETFHPEAGGWRECAYCKKRVHCGCIMAVHTYIILDTEGVQCLECSVNEAWASHRCLPEFVRPDALLQATDSLQIPPSDPEKTITGVHPVPPPGCVVRNASPNKVATLTTPGVAHQAQSPPAETEEEEDSVNSPDETKITRRKNGGKRRKGANKQTQVKNRYSPRTDSAELREICIRLKSSLVPLFEKELTVSDTDIKKGRLLLPKRCAETYFPKIPEQQGIFLMVQDTKGNAWKLHFRYWKNCNGKMYFLEGLRDCMILMQWEAGDTVTFYKREDGKLVMGFKKYQAPMVVVKSSTDV